MTDLEIVQHWQRGWDEAIEYVIEKCNEMQETLNFHNPTLEELEDRID
jgi:hypothetical protein